MHPNHPTATCFVHIVAIIMTAIMILHIRSKYTAVGRKEIVMFFWMYAAISLLAMLLDSGVIPTANVAYPVCNSFFISLKKNPSLIRLLR